MVCLRLDVQIWGFALEWPGGTSGTDLFLRERVGVYDISRKEQEFRRKNLQCRQSEIAGTFPDRQVYYSAMGPVAAQRRRSIEKIACGWKKNWASDEKFCQFAKIEVVTDKMFEG